MTNVSRTIGGNIYTTISNQKLSVEDIAKELGYSLKEMWSIIDGSIFIPPVELFRISKLLGTTADNLLAEENVLVPELQYMKAFDNPEDLEMILDLMDEYVAILEVV